MKNILKCLSVIAIAGTLGLNTVYADNTCAPGETEHTDYFMFLDVNPASYYETEINKQPAGSNLTQWNGAQKWNNVKGATIIETGEVAITKGSQTTNSGAAKSWTAAEYWKKYYEAASNKDSNLVYTNGNESYILHDKWWSYSANFEDGTEKEHTNTDTQDALMNLLKGNVNGLTNSSEIVANGTSVPNSIITVPGDLTTATNDLLLWKISRAFTSSDILPGISLNGSNRVYSPAVAYVTYCAKGGSSTSKKITYDKNTTGNVSNMPSDNTFTNTCTNIANSRPSMDGYTFLGWSEDSTATQGNPVYAPGSEYCGGDITLHAIWKQNTSNPDGSYTVTYDANGGKNAPRAQTGTTGTCVTISSDKPTLTGNKFLGWSTIKDAKEPDGAYAAGANYCGNNGNITLYAVWQPVTGISAHVVAFGVVALAAGAALVVAKKKDLFRQI